MMGVMYLFGVSCRHENTDKDRIMCLPVKYPVKHKFLLREQGKITLIVITLAKGAIVYSNLIYTY